MLSLYSTRRVPTPFSSLLFEDPSIDDGFFDLGLQPLSRGWKRHRPLSLLDSLFDDGCMIPSSTSKLTPNNMHLDIIERDKTYQVKADLPGAKKEDIKVTLNDKTNVLTLSATKSDELSQDTDNYKRRERYFGSVSRSIRLPKDSNLQAIECGYENGVLSLHVPKLPPITEAEAGEEEGRAEQRDQVPDPNVKSIRVN